MSKSSSNIRSVVFKIIIIIWMINIALSIIDNSLQIYMKIINQFYDGLYAPFYAKILRLFIFVLGWIFILYRCIQNRKKNFKGYNIILIGLIAITICTIGVCLNYYRDYINSKNNMYKTVIITSNNIHSREFYGREYFTSIDDGDGVKIYTSNKDYEKICCLFQIQDLDNEISNVNSDIKVNIMYLPYTKTIIKIEG